MMMMMDDVSRDENNVVLAYLIMAMTENAMCVNDFMILAYDTACPKPQFNQSVLYFFLSGVPHFLSPCCQSQVALLVALLKYPLASKKKGTESTTSSCCVGRRANRSLFRTLTFNYFMHVGAFE
jgi:cytochrome c biogenesis protein CcdA